MLFCLMLCHAAYSSGPLGRISATALGRPSRLQNSRSVSRSKLLLLNLCSISLYVVLSATKVLTIHETCTLFPYFFIFPPYLLIVRAHFFVHAHRDLTLINNSGIFRLKAGFSLYNCSILRNFASSKQRDSVL